MNGLQERLHTLPAAALGQIARGIEKESLRVDADARLR